MLDQAHHHLVCSAQGADVRLACSDIARVKSGWFGQFEMLSDGRKQFVAIYLPGDLIAIETLFSVRSEFQIGALTSGVLTVFDRCDIRKLRHDQPAVAEFLFREFALALSIEREWVVRVGRLNALERIAHLFCEIVERLNRPNFLQLMPLRHHDIADLVGISTVHVSRTLHALQEKGLVEISNRGIRVTNLAGLQETGMFDPSYLRFHDEPEPVRLQ